MKVVGWSSSTFERLVQEGSLGIIIVQAASLSLFLIMSQAWTDFFEVICESFLSTAELEKENSVWISLTRALSNTVFSIFLLAIIVFTINKGSLLLPRQRVIYVKKRHKRTEPVRV